MAGGRGNAFNSGAALDRGEPRVAKFSKVRAGETYTSKDAKQLSAVQATFEPVLASFIGLAAERKSGALRLAYACPNSRRSQTKPQLQSALPARVFSACSGRNATDAGAKAPQGRLCPRVRRPPIRRLRLLYWSHRPDEAAKACKTLGARKPRESQIGSSFGSKTAHCVP